MYYFRITAVLISLIPCFSSVDGRGHQVAQGEVFLDSNNQLLMKWQTDYNEQKVYFEIMPSESVPPFTWFALGFSDRGEFINADVCIFWSDYYSVYHYEDAYTDDSGKVIRDSKQNCDQFYFDPKTRTISVSTLFDTCDDIEDYVIEDGTVHVIWAYGDGLHTSSNNICLNCTGPQHGFTRVRLLIPTYVPQVGNAQELKFTTDNLLIPAEHTTYWCKVMRQPEVLDSHVQHIVQFGAVVTPGNEHIVHHTKLFYCDVEPNVEIPLYEGPCSERPATTKSCFKVKVAWAYGAPPFTYPEMTGVPLGGPDKNKYLMLETHYNNEYQRNDVYDSSGVFVKISERRQYDAGFLELGATYNDKMAIPPGQKHFTWHGYCVPQCTEVGLPLGGINVFASQLHMHLTGREMTTRQVRNGFELPLIDKDPHYSTHFQEIRLLRNIVRILPGDFLETTCSYNTEDRDNVTFGGMATTDEMCGNYLHYYPATELEVCKSSVSLFYLKNYFNFERRWYNISIDLDAPPRQNYLAIKPWTNNRVEMVESLYTEFPIEIECKKSTGVQFKGNWTDQPIPEIDTPYPKVRHCPKQFIDDFNKNQGFTPIKDLYE